MTAKQYLWAYLQLRLNGFKVSEAERILEEIKENAKDYSEAIDEALEADKP